MNQQLYRKFLKLEAKKEFLEKRKEKLEKELVQEKNNYENLTKVRYIFSEVSKNTQQIFKERLESLVTLALETVFPERNFKFRLLFEEKRNKIECRPVILEKDSEFNAEDELGGSVLDIIGFTLRIILWSMQNPLSRNTIILDEPFKWLDTQGNKEKAGQILKKISEKLNLQVIMITHDDELAKFADKTFCVRLVNNISIVKEVTNEKTF